jgi:hypothetical protein
VQHLMIVLILLLVPWVGLRGIGAAGVQALASWQDSARYALVVMFMFTATAHFNRMKHDLVRMIPAYFPRPHCWFTSPAFGNFSEQQDWCLRRFAGLPAFASLRS